jgi:hypothetical protein
MNGIAKAFEEADEYGDEFEAEDEGNAASSKAAQSGKSILAQAAEQIQAEARAEFRNILKEEVEASQVQISGIGDRANNALAVLNNALGADSSDDEELGDNAEADCALRVACYRGEARAVGKLLDSKDKGGGANPRARDIHGWTALHWACKSGDAACIDLLVDAVEKNRISSFLNIRDSLSGWTALHVAAISGKKDAIKSLIEHGANCEKRSLFDETPLDCVSTAARNSKQLRRLLGAAEESESKQSEGKHGEK